MNFLLSSRQIMYHSLFTVSPHATMRRPALCIYVLMQLPTLGTLWDHHSQRRFYGLLTCDFASNRNQGHLAHCLRSSRCYCDSLKDYLRRECEQPQVETHRTINRERDRRFQAEKLNYVLLREFVLRPLSGSPGGCTSPHISFEGMNVVLRGDGFSVFIERHTSHTS